MNGERLLNLTLARRALLAGSRLVCIDGPAGSGKTTLAAGLVTAAQARGLSTALVHMDDLYEGWGGLAAGVSRAREDVVEPLTRGRAGEYPRYDWHREEYVEQHAVPPADIVVIEGVGSGHAGYADRTTLLVWVEAPRDVRLRRGLERDGEALGPQWLQWAVDEGRLHAAERTRERAHVLVDGLSGRLSVRGQAWSSGSTPACCSSSARSWRV